MVDDPAAALARVAASFYGHPARALTAIGITGTDGKTTTARMVDKILQADGRAAASLTTIGASLPTGESRASGRLTTPEAPDVQSFLRDAVAAGATAAVLEATSHGLALGRVDAIPFAVGAVTNVTHEHLDFHRTPAAYRRAKGLLLERVAGNGGTVVVHADDEGARGLLPHAAGARIVLVGRAAPDATVRAVDVETRHDGSRFALVVDQELAVTVELALPCAFNVDNALCAAGVAHALGVEPATIARGLAALGRVPGRMRPVDEGQPFALVVDYAHTPAALHAVLSHLRGIHRGRLIVVIGSGGERDRVKRPWLAEIATTHADAAVFTSEDPRHEAPERIVAEMVPGAVGAGGREGETFACVVDRRDAIRYALALAGPGDCILLAGKGHERSIVYGSTELPWNEERVARELLHELGHRGNGA